MRRLIKYFTLFLWGGFMYYCVEMLARGYSHPSMFIVGGACFVLIGLINNLLPWEMPLLLQMLMAAVIIVVAEFIAGCIVNLWLGLGVWDYSNLPFNIMGQVCLSYFMVWYCLSVVAIVFDDYLRWWIYGEEKPRYVLW